MLNAKDDKREKFVKLAEARTNKTLNMINLIGNLSNKSLYKYSDEDVTEIFRAIQEELNSAKRRFDSNKRDSTPSFKLKSR